MHMVNLFGGPLDGQQANVGPGTTWFDELDPVNGGAGTYSVDPDDPEAPWTWTYPATISR